MNTALVLAYSKVTTVGSPPMSKLFSLRHFNKQLVDRFAICSPPTSKVFSLGHFNKHLVGRFTTPLKKCTCSNPHTLSFSHSIPPLQSTTRTSLLQLTRCTSTNTTSLEAENPIVDKLNNISFNSIRESISQLTPIDICKWSLVFSFIIAATKWTMYMAFNPFIWMYFSWSWLFWPWYIALALAIYGIHCFRKHIRNEANSMEQVAIVTSVFTWLTLVPPAYFNGFLEGWPFVFFFVYHYFFFFNVTVRNRMYGDLYPHGHNPKWEITLPTWQRVLFSVGVVAGHWLAAFEGPELHLLPSGSINVWIWVLIVMNLFMHYHSTLYLAKYSEKVVEPTSVVQFGPYRFVRHPIYASTMLLFATYFAALRAPLSLLFIVATCVSYYDQKVKVEEALMVETFGWQYKQYAEKVKYKFIPFVY